MGWYRGFEVAVVGLRARSSLRIVVVEFGEASAGPVVAFEAAAAFAGDIVIEDGMLVLRRWLVGWRRVVVVSSSSCRGR